MEKTSKTTLSRWMVKDEKTDKHEVKSQSECLTKEGMRVVMKVGRQM